MVQHEQNVRRVLPRPLLKLQKLFKSWSFGEFHEPIEQKSIICEIWYNLCRVECLYLSDRLILAAVNSPSFPATKSLKATPKPGFCPAMRGSYVGDVSLFGSLAYEDLVPADVKPRLRHLRGVALTNRFRICEKTVA